MTFPVTDATNATQQLLTGAELQTALQAIATAATAPGTQAVSAANLPLPAGAATAALQAFPGVGYLATIPAGSANGTPIGTPPASARAVRMYLPANASVSFTVATAQPTSAPTAFTISNSTTGPNWDEPIAVGVNVYVTAASGGALFRFI